MALPFFNRFPYTNIGDINLDWIIKQVKILKTKVDNLDPEDFEDRLEVVEAEAAQASVDAASAASSATDAAGSAASAVTAATAAQSTANAAQTAANAAQSDIDNLENVVDTLVRPNLLDNWYFVKGTGTTGNYGVFPVNQRGQGSYSGTQTYSIDRWIIRGSNTITLTDTGIRIGAESAFHSLRQPLAIKPAELAGKKVTLSAKIESFTGTGLAKLRLYNANVSYGVSAFLGTVNISGAGVVHASFNMPDTFSYSMLNVGIGTDDNSDADFVVSAIKLGNDWVLNEIPNYGDQLSRCQRYYVRINADGNNSRPIGYGYSASATVIRLTFILPEVLAATPSISSSGSLILRCYKSSPYLQFDAPTFAQVYLFGNTCTASLSSTGLTANESYVMSILGSGGYLEFSAEL